MKFPLTWLFSHNAKLTGVFQFPFSLFLITKCCSFFPSTLSFWVTSSNFTALNTSLYLDDSQMYMSSLVLLWFPLKQSHLVSNRYLTLNMSKKEILIPISTNLLPFSFSVSVNGTTSHTVTQIKDLWVILSLFSHTPISKSHWLCLHCDPLLPICTATTLT